MVANQGWRLLPQYRYQPETALWRHRDGLPKPPTSLVDFDFESGRKPDAPRTAPIDVLPEYLAEAKDILAREPVPDGEAPDLGPEIERLRWFPNPTETGE